MRNRWTPSLRRVFGWSALALGLLILIACALPWHGFTLLEWERESHSGRVLWKGETHERLVALTFDDGPAPRNTPRILAILHRYGVRATFFQIGKQVERYPRLAQAVRAQGHEIGNHTYTHPYLDRQSPEIVARELDGCDRSLASALRLRTHLFRPPRGDWNPTIFRAAQQRSDYLILWTLALEHHEVRTPQEMAERALRLVQPGAIILMHDGGNRETTVEALPLLLEGLRARGYRCVTVPELLHIPGDREINHPLR